jgi:leader peptidase (prepilin peptidase)/N-methyltransferase
MREVVWALVGWLFGIGAARRAKNVIAQIHFAGGGYVHGLLNTKPGFVPAVSLINAAAAFGIATTLTGNFATFAFVVFATNLVQQMFVDIDTHLLPKGRTRGATFFGLVLLGLATISQHDWSRFGWALLGSLLMWLVMRVLQAVSRGDLGGGDVTLATLLGLHLGWLAIGNVFISLFVSCVLGGVAGLATLVVRRNRRHFIAFGPWLVIGALLTVVFEQSLRRVLLG